METVTEPSISSPNDALDVLFDTLTYALTHRDKRFFDTTLVFPALKGFLEVEREIPADWRFLEEVRLVTAGLRPNHRAFFFGDIDLRTRELGNKAECAPASECEPELSSWTDREPANEITGDAFAARELSKSHNHQ